MNIFQKGRRRGEKNFLVPGMFYVLGWVIFLNLSVHLNLERTFNFAETFFMESPLPPESRMVHIIEIGCAQNCHKAWENWAKICLFVALLTNFEKTYVGQF